MTHEELVLIIALREAHRQHGDEAVWLGTISAASTQALAIYDSVVARNLEDLQYHAQGGNIQ